MRTSSPATGSSPCPPRSTSAIQPGRTIPASTSSVTSSPYASTRPAGKPNSRRWPGACSQVLDRSKPLWEIHLVDGLKDGRGALIARIHHALADGVAGAALLRVMLDSTPQGSRAARQPRARAASPPPAEHTLA